MGYYASKCHEKKRGKTKKDFVASAVVKEFASKLEHEFSLISIDSSVGISTFEHVYVVDSGSTIHMTGLYDAYQSYHVVGTKTSCLDEY